VKKIVFRCLLGIGILSLYIPGFLRLGKSYLYLQRCEKEIEKFKEENKQLKKDIEKFSQNPFYIEKLGREELGLIKKGEFIYKTTQIE